MTFGKLFRRFRTLLHASRVEDDIQRELEFHIAMEAAERERRGLSPSEARRTTLRDFGPVRATRESVRDARGLTLWDTLAQDVRFAVRTLRRWPGYTAGTLVTLALGIGINTAIFSVVNDVLLRPLPYRDDDRLVRIVQSVTRPTAIEAGVSVAELADYRARVRSLDDVVEYHEMGFVLLDDGEPDRVDTGVVSTNYFETFGVRPLVGRGFTDLDDDAGAEPVLLLSHDYWQRKFSGSTRVVGQRVQMNDRAHRIIGVLPAIPQYPDQNDVYMPTSACPFRAIGETESAKTRRAFGLLSVFARLKPGTTLEEASGEVSAVAAGFAGDHATVYQPDLTQFKASLTGLNDEIVKDARGILLALLATTVLVLLIACANVANLTLSRLARREREVALRFALGAGRGRLVRQLLTESLLVAAAGGALGLLVAWGALDLLVPFAGRYTSRVIEPSLDGTVLAFTAGVSLATGLLFGILPALGARPSLAASLKDAGGQVGEGRKPRRLRSALVVGQVAVCFALLVSAGLFIDTLRRLTAVDLGFRADRVLTAEVFSNWSNPHAPADLRRLYGTILDRLRSTRGVVSAAVTNGVPLADILPGNQPIEIDGVTPPDLALLPLADQRVASEGYFETLGLEALRGRVIEARDDERAAPVAVINESMARLWGDADPVGRTFTPHDSRVTFTVIGVVADFRQFSMDRAAGAQFYIPFKQSPGIGARVLVRTEGDPLDYVSALKAAVHAADPEVPVESIDTLEALRAWRLESPGLNAALLASFAGLALLITLAGLTAVLGSYVSQRTREFGVRMALGATPVSLVVTVLRQGMALVAVGLIGGVVAAVLFGQGIRAFLYETTPTDPVVFAVMGGVFVLASLAACLGPARRATAIDPLRILKTD
jgi:putative ABC transport system permease protein